MTVKISRCCIHCGSKFFDVVAVENLVESLDSDDFYPFCSEACEFGYTDEFLAGGAGGEEDE